MSDSTANPVPPFDGENEELRAADPSAAAAAAEGAEGAAGDGPDNAPAAEDGVAAERDEYLDALQRLKAEFDNYRKRAERDRQAAGLAGARELVRGLLPVADNLERAVAALAGNDEAVIAGVEMVRAQLVGVLTANGVGEIAAGEGVEFDPNLHEAIAQVPVPDAPAGRILEVVEKGYTHADLVVRPAKVVVAAEPPQ